MRLARSVMLLMLTLYLGLYNDYLALWDTNHPQPEKVYPYHVSLYPKIDKSSLEKGIEITSSSHLSQLIEDFLS